MKSNYAQSGEQIRLEWKNSVYTPEVKGGYDTVDRIDRSVRAREMLLETIDDTISQGRITSASSNAANYLPKVAKNRPGAGDLSFKDLVRAMEDLFARKVIVVGSAGKQPNRTARVGIIRAENCP